MTNSNLISNGFTTIVSKMSGSQIAAVLVAIGCTVGCTAAISLTDSLDKMVSNGNLTADKKGFRLNNHEIEVDSNISEMEEIDSED